MFKLGEPINEMTTAEAETVLKEMLAQRGEDSRLLRIKLEKEQADDDGEVDTAAIIRRTVEKYERAVNEVSALIIALSKFPEHDEQRKNVERSADLNERTNATDVQLWVIGTDEDDARESLIWEDEASAQEAADDSEDSLNVYSVTARIQWDTLSA